MIQEAYVSFEVAKLLKEKGFNNPCLRAYDNKGIICIRYTGFDVPHDYFNRQLYLCSTHQMAMKWLREVHNIFIVIRRGLTGTGWVYSHEIYKDSKCWYAQYAASYDTYEEGVETALKFCLENLI